MVRNPANRRNNEWQNIPNVTWHYGDRDSHLEFIKMLRYISKKIGINGEEGSKKWSLVVDFCAYLRKEIKSCIRGLSNMLKLYVFISTDSVYDVCDTEIREGPVKESDDLRPNDDAEIKKKADDEDYGHDKLKCEEYLRSHVGALNTGFNFLCLRLPDVIGPYDSTCRYWAYLLWLRDMERRPIHSHDESKNDKLSFVYSCDVSNLIISFLPRIDDQEFLQSVHKESFNIAFEENPTLDQLIQKIVKIKFKAFFN